MNKPRRPATFPAASVTSAGAHELLRPQRTLAGAAEHAARQATPSGLGLDSPAVRTRMVDRLRGAGITSAPVLEAFARVPRHHFVDSALAAQAYDDTSLPIGHGQTISKPSVVARMLVLLLDGANARQGRPLRVLEIGTGCGYQAALLSLLARQVISIERLRPLHEQARERLRGWREGDIRLLHGDGRNGHAPSAPYDAIIAAAGGDALPAAWLEQLAVGGRLVAPVHDAARSAQQLTVVDRTEQGLVTRVHEAVHFVPLKSGVA